MTQFTPISDARARSTQGATEGFCDATTSTTKESVDLSSLAGAKVKIYCETQNHYFFFDADGTTTLLLTAQSVGTAGVPDSVASGPTGVEVVVPKSKPFLNYAAAASTGIIRVLPV